MTTDSSSNANPTCHPWTGGKSPVKGRIFHCRSCKSNIQVEFDFGGKDTVYYDARSVFPLQAGQTARYGKQQSAGEYLTDEVLCDSCFRTLDMERAQSAHRQVMLAIVDADRAISQNDEACYKPLKELHDAMLLEFLKTFDFSILQELHPEAYSKSIGDPRFLNPNSRNSMIQKYLSSGGGRRIALLFVDAICTEGKGIFSNLASANGPHLETIAKNLPYANDGGYAAPWNIRRKLSLIFPSLVARNNCGYAPWNIRRAISLNDFGGLIETQPRIPAPNTPDIDVWAVGALNLNYFCTMVEERSQPENRPETEDDPDNGALMFVAKTVLDYPRFERAFRKLMMGQQPEVFC